MRLWTKWLSSITETIGDSKAFKRRNCWQLSWKGSVRFSALTVAKCCLPSFRNLKILNFLNRFFLWFEKSKNLGAQLALKQTQSTPGYLSSPLNVGSNVTSKAHPSRLGLSFLSSAKISAGIVMHPSLRILPKKLSLIAIELTGLTVTFKI